MSEHAWGVDKDGAESCAREGCTVRRSASTYGRTWQAKKRGHWMLETPRHPVPPCTGKDAAPEAEAEHPTAPCRVCGESGGQHKMSCRPSNRRDSAKAETIQCEACGKDWPVAEFGKAGNCGPEDCAAPPAPSPLEVVRERVRGYVQYSRKGEFLADLATLEEAIRADALKAAEARILKRCCEKMQRDGFCIHQPCDYYQNALGEIRAEMLRK